MLAQDRCDAGSCGAQAYLRVALRDAGTLDFCHHHYALYQDALSRQGAVIVADDRRMLSRETVLYSVLTVADEQLPKSSKAAPNAWRSLGRSSLGH